MTTWTPEEAREVELALLEAPGAKALKDGNRRETPLEKLDALIRICRRCNGQTFAPEFCKYCSPYAA